MKNVGSSVNAVAIGLWGKLAATDGNLAYSPASIAIALAMTTAVSSYATVYFQNTGLKAGWDDVYTQQVGSIDEVASPTWNNTGTALAFTQTWNGVLTGHHSEAVKFTTQSEGEDRYYGKVIYFPSNWYVENDNYTFSQYSPENPSGPWMLNWIQSRNLKIQDRHGAGLRIRVGFNKCESLRIPREKRTGERA